MISKAPKLTKKSSGHVRVNHENLIPKETLSRILEIQVRQDFQCELIMNQIGICGIPSLWCSTQNLLSQKHLLREQVALLEKYHKMHSILRCHRKWENEKMFGKNNQAIVIAGQAP